MCKLLLSTDWAQASELKADGPVKTDKNEAACVFRWVHHKYRVSIEERVPPLRSVIHFGNLLATG